MVENPISEVPSQLRIRYLSSSEILHSKVENTVKMLTIRNNSFLPKVLRLFLLIIKVSDAAQLIINVGPLPNKGMLQLV